MKNNRPPFYLKQLRRIWRRIPASCRGFAAVHAFGRHVDRIARTQSERSQHFATFFLRNRPEMNFLQRIAQKKPQGARLDVTVVACSKGAEVYSIAWALRTARPDLDLRIHAVDISPEIVEFAERGIYSMRQPQDSDPTSEEAVRQKKGVRAIPTSDRYAWIFERLSPQEMDDMFAVHGDEAAVRPWLRKGIVWHCGDAGDPKLAASLGPQDIVVANRFLCHMMPADAEKCLRGIGRLVKPAGYLSVYGVDLDVRTKVAREGNWKPVIDLIREIHDGDSSMRNAWPVEYWGIEPLDDTRADWRLRYASVFQIGGEASSPLEDAALARTV